MITLRLKKFSAIAIATVLRKLTCSKTCRPKLDLACNKKYGNIFYILISVQFYNCLFCCENKGDFSLEQPIKIDSLMSSTLMSNG